MVFVSEIGNDSASLLAMLRNANEALAGFGVQITTAEARIEELKGRIDTDNMKLLEDAQKVSELDAQVREAETQVGHAQKTAQVAKGSGVEKSTGARVKSLQSELVDLQQKLGVARLQHDAIEIAVRVGRKKIEQQITEAEAEHDALLAEQKELEQIRAETHSRLGQAIYREIMTDGAAFVARLKELDEAKLDAQVDYRSLQTSIQERLAGWPGLAEQAEAAHGIPQPPPRDTPQEALVKLYKAFLRAAFEHGRLVASDTGWRNLAAQQLQIPEPDLRLMFSERAAQEDRWKVYQDRCNGIDAWARDFQYKPWKW